MRPLSTLGRAFVLLLLAAGSARAVPILDVTSALTTGDPVQMGRLSRNGIPQDWAGTEPFPGVINPATSYHYIALALDVAALEAGLGFSYGGFIQIDFDSTASTTFLSAYLDVYSPANLAANWLGDAGASGNFFSWRSPIFSSSCQAAMTWCWCSMRRRPMAV